MYCTNVEHLSNEHNFSQELFSKAYDNVGVLFASIPNFTQFYSEDVNRGMECIRLLNEIIGKWSKLTILIHDQISSFLEGNKN